MLPGVIAEKKGERALLIIIIAINLIVHYS